MACAEPLSNPVVTRLTVTVVPWSRSVAVPASGCRIYNNTANVTATDVPSYSKDASASVQVCRQAPPTPPVTPPTTPVTSASVPSKTTVSLVKHASSPTVKAGGTVGFTIVWKNTGKAKAKNVVICDDLPNHLAFVSAKGATFKNGKACWKRAFVAKGATLTFRVVARVDAGDTEWLTSPRLDSYHTVWMQLHEDLLLALGRDRSAEPDAVAEPMEAGEEQ